MKLQRNEILLTVKAGEESSPKVFAHYVSWAGGKRKKKKKKGVNKGGGSVRLDYVEMKGGLTKREIVERATAQKRRKATAKHRGKTGRQNSSG